MLSNTNDPDNDDARRNALPVVSPDDVRKFFRDAAGIVAEREPTESESEFMVGILSVFCADILNNQVVAESWRRQIAMYVRNQRD